MPNWYRPLLAILTAALLASSPAFALQSPLSDEAIREAYFLGQRHDGSVERLLGKYIKQLPPPKTGPHISSVSLLTPFLQLAQFSGRYVGNYSAQQASLDHRSQQETVVISINIVLTDSYRAFLAAPPHLGSPQGYVRRPHDFWKDFQVQVFEGEEIRVPAHFTGAPNYSCSRWGDCILTGATIRLEFPPTALVSDSAAVQVIPPEGPEVWVDFDLTALR